MALQLLGTSHIAEKSVNAVKSTIKSLEPDIVTIELDKNRLSAVLSAPQEIPLRAIKELGLFGFLFAKFGAHLQRKLGHKTGIFPGAEMKAAFIAASAIGAKIVLIDRPINQTLQRLVKIPAREKLAILSALIFGWFPKSKRISFDIASVPTGQTLDSLLIEFKHILPSTYNILVTERDEYMAKRLLKLELLFPQAKILAIVGAGHLAGIRKRIKTTNV